MKCAPQAFKCNSLSEYRENLSASTLSKSTKILGSHLFKLQSLVTKFMKTSGVNKRLNSDIYIHLKKNQY